MQDQANTLMEAVSIFRLEASMEHARTTSAKPASTRHIARSASVTAIKPVAHIKTISHAGTSAPVTRERKQLGGKVERDGDWKEF
jgi:hypothetical protein